MVKKD